MLHYHPTQGYRAAHGVVITFLMPIISLSASVLTHVLAVL